MPIRLAHRLNGLCRVAVLLVSTVVLSTVARADDLFVAYGVGGYFPPNYGNYSPTIPNGAVADLSATTAPNLPPLFVADGSGGLYNSRKMAFGPDGDLYVGNGNDVITKYDGSTGAYVGVLGTGATSVGSLDFNNGYLYAAVSYRDRAPAILKIDTSTGTIVNSYNASVFGLCNMPNGDLLYLGVDSGTLTELNPTTGNTTVFAQNLPATYGPGGLTAGSNGSYFVLAGSKLYTVPSTGGSGTRLGGYGSYAMGDVVYFDGNLYATDQAYVTNSNAPDGVVDEFNVMTGDLIGQIVTADTNLGGFAIRGTDVSTSTPEPGVWVMLAGLGFTTMSILRRRKQ